MLNLFLIKVPRNRKKCVNLVRQDAQVMHCLRRETIKTSAFLHVTTDRTNNATKI